MKKRKILVPLLLILMFFGVPIGARYVFPLGYESYVDRYSSECGVDKLFVMAVIKTESDFDPNARSEVGARGLMQLMDEAFEWVALRKGDDRFTYDDMYEPEHNIEYGTYMISLLYDEYGDERTALAAYHAGRGAVRGWLSDSDYSSDGKTLDTIPSSVTAHYVDKVMGCYFVYKLLYGE